MLVAHPVLNSMLGCYEIDMIRRESQCIMLPYLPARWNPEIRRLYQCCAIPQRSPIGAIEQVVFERAAKDRSRRAVLSHFARDVDLIRSIAGEVMRVGALGGSGPQTGYANLTVQMSGEGPAVIRWSIGPVGEFAGGWLTVIGTKDRIELSPPGDESSNAAAIAELAEEASEDIDRRLGCADGGARTIVAGDRASRGRARFRRCHPRHRVGRSDSAQPRAWPDDRSAARTPTEEGTFKGLMTSLGCGLLLVGLLLVVAMAVLDFAVAQPTIGELCRQSCDRGRGCYAAFSECFWRFKCCCG